MKETMGFIPAYVVLFELSTVKSTPVWNIADGHAAPPSIPTHADAEWVLDVSPPAGKRNVGMVKLPWTNVNAPWFAMLGSTVSMAPATLELNVLA
jgi:hypothetical protein